MKRKEAVAGYFYPGNIRELEKYLSSVINYVPEYKPKVIIVPHAGYAYSGYVAAKAYSIIKNYDIYVLLGPNHTGLGEEISIFDGVYQTPLGEVKPCKELIDEIAGDFCAKKDYLAHLKEHSIEVELPFMQFTNKKDFCIVPIVIGTFDIANLTNLGLCLAKALENKDALIVVSSDLNHYENNEITLEKDNLAIEKILSLSPNEFFETVIKNNISMCGANAAYVALVASLKMKASGSLLIEHKTSADVNGSTDHVVGYASIFIQ